MPCTAGMKLVFRLGESGFSLSVDDLVEIREEDANLLADGRNRPGPYSLGMLTCRDQEIPVIDLTALLRISSEMDYGDPLKLLVLVGESGFWSVPVSRIEGIFPLAAFSACRAPWLSIFPGSRPYNAIELWREEPLVRCDALWLEQFWCLA